MPAHYYDAVETATGYFGRVYHYDASGNKEIIDFKTPEVLTEGEAVDAAVEWAEENNIEVELG